MTDSTDLLQPASLENPGHSFFSSVYSRFVGVLILFKLMIPLFIVIFITLSIMSMVRSVNRELDRLNASLQPKFERVQVEIENVRAEGRRLADKVAKIKNQGAKAAKDIQNAVEPIRQSLLAISSTIGAISEVMESFINSIVRALRKIPFVKGLKTIQLPKIAIPGFKLPELNIDLGLTFDTAAINALKDLVSQIADEAQASIDAMVKIWLIWWWTFKASVFLILSWLLISLVGAVARFWNKMKTGLQLISGRKKTASLQML